MSAGTKSKRLKRLLSHGYFAPELPPCFVSNALARQRKSLLAAIDALPLTRRGDPNYYRYVSEPVWFYFPRFAQDDRRHGIPNPIAHLLLSRVIADNYVMLRRVGSASKISLSPAVFDWSGSRALMRPSVDLRDRFRSELSSRREAYVAADVRAFFHSVYTHAIPWAIHGKDFAKRHRGADHFGNLIDLLCRNAQDGQTIGLPVGPDTSRFIAETLASAIDVRLQNQLNITRRDASRYIDDYTLSSGGNETGEELLAALRLSAAYFELELNNDKSNIVATSRRQITGWQQSVRAHLPRKPPWGLARTETVVLEHYFYELGQLCSAHPDINVEKFGLQNARAALVNADEWGPVQASLISAYRRNSTLVSLLVEVCLLRQVAHGDLLLGDLQEFIENRIAVLARANRTGEAVWLLFLAIRLRLKLSVQALKSLFLIENALIALLVTCLDARELVDGRVDRTVWDRSLTPDGLRSSMWLYAYEAVTQGFLGGVSSDFIDRDQYFSLLRARRIQFLDVEQGFLSISTTLRNLRNENERLRLLRERISQMNIDEIDDEEIDEDEENSDIY